MSAYQRNTELVELLKGYIGTCAIDNLKDGCVSFITKKKYLSYLYKSAIIKNVCVIMPIEFYVEVDQGPDLREGVECFYSPYPLYEFALYHNWINRDKFYPENNINSRMHISVVICDGLRLAVGPENQKIQIKHMGNVVIGEDVDIGPNSVIHRGLFESTIIERGNKIGALCNIGHNCVIGEDNVLAAGVIINGSVTVGNNCWIGSGVTIRNGVSICNNVRIGMGSVVTKSIYKSGTYFGNPVKYQGEFVPSL